MSTTTRPNITAEALLAASLQFLVNSGFIDAAEVGTFAQTTHGLNAAATEERIWASLCNRVWLDKATFPTSVAETMGHRWLYRQWSAPIAKRKPPSDRLSPPSCTADQIHLFVIVRHRGVPIYTNSGSLGGEVLSQLLENGEAVQSLEENPIIITSDDGDFGDGELDGRIQVLRTTDSAMCCVFSSKLKFHGVQRDDDEEIIHHFGINLNRHIRVGTSDLDPDFSFSFDGPLVAPEGSFREMPLRQSSMAKDIKNRFSEPMGFGLSAGVEIVYGESLRLVITSITVKAISLNCDDIRASPPVKVFDSQEQEDKHGVTLLHFLSELQGTEFHEE